MKSRTALLDRKPVLDACSPPRIGSLPAINALPLGPDCDDDCPFCQGPETD
ncbi:hypothetical protein ACFRAU_13380 [Arthrobacter sp. NPDC056691]|uniref:hypothetical protein n=1 Tax=unclassified Arthrobacter TaxID=235627 RepID=UPI00366CBB99